MVNRTAQTELNNKYPSQASKNTVTKLDIGGVLSSVGSNPVTDKLVGKLVIEGFSALTEIDLKKQELTDLELINCPNLKKINVGENNLTRLVFDELKIDGSGNAINADKLEELNCPRNSLARLSFLKCLNLKRFYCQDNPHLDHFGGIEKVVLQAQNIGNTKIRNMHSEKINYLKDVVKIAREMAGVGPDEDLPKDSSGKLDMGKLKTKMTDGAASQIPQLKSEKEKADQERDAVQAQLAAAQTERDQLQQNFQAIIQKLGLGSQSTQDQVLTKIEELMNRPNNDSSDKDNRINELEKQVSEKDQRIKELENGWDKLISKQNIIENLKSNSLSLSAARRAEIVDASSSQEAWKIRDQAIKERFGELEQSRKNAFHLNIALGVLAVLSLLGVGYLVIWKLDSPIKKDADFRQAKKKKGIRNKKI